ncbi:MAG: succinate dehydrogenase assembly factor 4 [Stellaceae bacterium]
MDDSLPNQQLIRPTAPVIPPKATPSTVPAPREIGGPKGPEPTRYGDWEVGGRCTDF